MLQVPLSRGRAAKNGDDRFSWQERSPAVALQRASPTPLPASLELAELGSGKGERDMIVLSAETAIEADWNRFDSSWLS